jgi:aldehyde dehydrogenase (NAD(P)+)
LTRGELAMSPRPPWFVTASTAPKTAELLTQFAAKPAWRRVPAIVLSALRG